MDSTIFNFVCENFYTISEKLEWDYLNTVPVLKLYHVEIIWFGHEDRRHIFGGMRCWNENPKRIIVTTNKLKRKRQNRLTTLDQNKKMCVFLLFICKERERESDHAVCVRSLEKKQQQHCTECVCVYVNAILVDTLVYQTVFHICTCFRNANTLMEKDGDFLTNINLI